VSLRFQQIQRVNLTLRLREVKVLTVADEDEWVKVAMGDTLDSSVTLDKLGKMIDKRDPLVLRAAIILVLTGFVFIFNY
ncbi:unnamed protein product, partial [Ixodes hexagonus]